MKTPIFHNPHNLTDKQIETHLGWRLLLVEEVHPRPLGDRGIEVWGDSGQWFDARWLGNNKSLTYRVKWPLPEEYQPSATNGGDAQCENASTTKDACAIPVGNGPASTSDPSGEGQLFRNWLGKEVREAWIKWAKTQPDPKSSWLDPYEFLNECDKEADRQIGEHLWSLFQGKSKDRIEWLNDRVDWLEGQREIAIPEGWRKLDPEEKILVGDHYLNEEKMEWVQSVAPGGKVPYWKTYIRKIKEGEK